MHFCFTLGPCHFYVHDFIHLGLGIVLITARMLHAGFNSLSYLYLLFSILRIATYSDGSLSIWKTTLLPSHLLFILDADSLALAARCRRTHNCCLFHLLLPRNM